MSLNKSTPFDLYYTIPFSYAVVTSESVLHQPSGFYHERGNDLKMAELSIMF